MSEKERAQAQAAGQQKPKQSLAKRVVQGNSIQPNPAFKARKTKTNTMKVHLVFSSFRA